MSSWENHGQTWKTSALRFCKEEPRPQSNWKSLVWFKYVKAQRVSIPELADYVDISKETCCKMSSIEFGTRMHLYSASVLKCLKLFETSFESSTHLTSVNRIFQGNCCFFWKEKKNPVKFQLIRQRCQQRNNVEAQMMRKGQTVNGFLVFCIMSTL